ncbi:MAG: alanine racemase [Woeseiaceae bacterium]|nr:alanine racemase [Woeseiaceae bacterium]
MSFGARALIRLGAITHNLKVIRDTTPGARVMAVIKANAYGHGMVPVAGQLGDADCLAVARLPEALELRESGIDKPITLLSGVFGADELQAAGANRLELVVHCQEQLELIETHLDHAITLWLKIDTGMNRLGFEPRQAGEVIARLRAANPAGKLCLMTHFADADNLEGPLTADQFQRIAEVVDGFDGDVSVANSAAMLGWPDIADARSTLKFDGRLWVRPGIAIYGISPFAETTAADLGLKPVMQFEARLIARKRLNAGSQVGYKGRYVSDADTWLGIIAAGYGDGYSRHFADGTPVLINGRRVPLIGNVSMDMIAVDLGADSTDVVGDVATLWGDGLPVEEVAPWAGAIPYELVCGVMNREPSKIIA